jgi:hypothetical protein
MKRLILAAFLSCIAYSGFGQSSTFIGVYGGGGLAFSYNYNVGISGGIDFFKGINAHTGIGFNLFYQSINLLYDNEAYGATGGTGNAGVTLLNESGYIFLTPKLVHDVDRRGLIKFNLNAGLGFKMSGTETMRKWDRSFGNSYGNYDSTINTTPNINSMLIRVGFGFTEFVAMRGAWDFTFTEDFGFMANEISKSGDANFGSRTYYGPGSMKPGYVSLQIGLMHLNGKH